MLSRFPGSLSVAAACAAVAFSGCGDSGRSGVYGRELSKQDYEAKAKPVLERDLALIRTAQTTAQTDPARALRDLATNVRKMERDLRAVGTPPKDEQRRIFQLGTALKYAAGQFDRADTALSSGDTAKAKALTLKGQTALAQSVSGAGG